MYIIAILINSVSVFFRRGDNFVSPDENFVPSDKATKFDDFYEAYKTMENLKQLGWNASLAEVITTVKRVGQHDFMDKYLQNHDFSVYQKWNYEKVRYIFDKLALVKHVRQYLIEMFDETEKIGYTVSLIEIKNCVEKHMARRGY